MISPFYQSSPLYSYIADGSPFGGNLFINDTGDQLDVMGTLYLQKLSLGNIDIFSGLIVLDDNGNITTKGTVKADKIEAEEGHLSDNTYWWAKLNNYK